MHLRRPILFISIFIFSWITVPAGVCISETAKIVLKKTVIRESCKFYAPVKKHVKYEDVIEILSEEGDWLSVRFEGVAGCIHKTAIEKVAPLSPVLLDSEIDPDDEVALAGKAFGEEFEEEYQDEHPELPFNQVDQIESYQVEASALEQFIYDGGLNLP